MIETVMKIQVKEGNYGGIGLEGKDNSLEPLSNEYLASGNDNNNNSLVNHSNIAVNPPPA
jgi:hypothetical protein